MCIYCFCSFLLHVLQPSLSLSLEHCAAVVLQLGDRLLDIIQCPVRSLLGWGGRKLARVPAAGELLDGRDVDDAVVQVVDDGPHLALEEDLVCVDSVAREDPDAWIWDVALDEGEDLGAGVGGRDLGGEDCGGQAGLVFFYDCEKQKNEVG